MTCASCGARRAKRACPALGRDICSTCCGTKRLAEIACPSDCTYLASARSHPPAVAVRRRERDFRFLYELIHGLPDGAYSALGAVHDAVVGYRVSAIPPLVDRDVAEAAGALASTLETASKGIIYDHQPSSLPAQRLSREIRAALDTWTRGTGQPPAQAERWAAEALRRAEKGARTAGDLLGGERAYLDLLDRLPREAGESEGGAVGGHLAVEPDAPARGRPPSKLILP